MSSLPFAHSGSGPDAPTEASTGPSADETLTSDDVYIPSIDPGPWWPGLAIGIGLVLIVLAIRPRSHPPT